MSNSQCLEILPKRRYKINHTYQGDKEEVVLKQSLEFSKVE